MIIGLFDYVPLLKERKIENICCQRNHEIHLSFQQEYKDLIAISTYMAEPL